MHSPDQSHPIGTQLLDLARASIEHGLDRGTPLPVDEAQLPSALAEHRASFVTLELAGQLRGCCGNLEAVRPLAQDVSHSAFHAAFEDPRFRALGRVELNAIDVEVSVLSPLASMKVADETDLLAQLVPGTDGLVIVAGHRRATFLPKVWESLPQPESFLAQLKLKCGLPEDYWSEHFEFFRYHTTIYGENTR
jgi:AmmeMemoRadiSam system protein A